MKAHEFILYTLAVAIGTTVALAVAGLYVRSQLTSATGTGTTLGSLLSLFSKPAATTTGS